MRPSLRPFDRNETLAALASEPLDLLIVGGGITGAALAYLATQVQPRLRVGLCEAADFASGTSSRSSQLLHGGLRYLAQGRVGLVRRLLRGRQEIAGLAPHLVAPARFVLPLHADDPYPGWVLRAALKLYGLLEARWADGAGAAADILRPGRLGAREATAREPLLAGTGLDQALCYGELAVHDARLVVELVMAAAAAGAHVLPRARCQRVMWREGQVTGALVEDVLTGRAFVARAKVVVNAAGPFGDALLEPVAPGQRLHLSRGSHLLLPAERLPLRETVVFFSPRDRRAMFASPRAGHVLVGTTEVAHRGPAIDPVPAAAEIRYLLEAVAQAFPAAGLRPSDVAGAFAGVRALALPGQAGDGADAACLDRGYAIEWDAPGLLALRGGKLTLAFHGARRALAAIHRRRRALDLPALAVPPLGALAPLPTALGPDLAAAAIEQQRLTADLVAAGLPAPTARRLVSSYGRGAEAIAAIVAQDRAAAAPVRPGLPALVAELQYACRFQAAGGLEDFARRRSDLHWQRALAAWRRAHGRETSPRLPLDTPAPGRAA